MWSGRTIAGALVAALATLGSVACQDDELPTTVATPDTAAVTAAGPPAATGCPVPEAGPVEPRSVVIPGPSNGLPPSKARAEKLIIVAVVLDPACNPASGADLNIWHTDATGEYGPEGTDACCYYRGTVRTDQNGRFRLESIRPGRYNQASAPLAHVHLEIEHPSGRLDTEIVFADNPTPPGPIRPSGQVAVFLRSVSGSWYGETAFVLEP
jgi:protocatechuate 3,4-dioxygenase beta subunit